MTFQFRAGGVRLAGLAYGDATRTPLVLVHGIRDHAGSFDPIARALADDYYVLAPDLRGHGDSDKPGSYSMAELVADVRALVLERELRDFVLVGHSLGGQIATQYAGVFGGVAALASLEGLGPPRRPGEAGAEGRRARWRDRVESLLERAEPREPLADFAAALARFQKRNPRLAPERARALVERGIEPAPGGGVRWKWSPDVQRVWTTIGIDDTEQIWSWIRCPVLVVTAAESASYWTQRGLSDPLPPDLFAADVERKLACFADVEHVVVDGAGHMLHYDQPDALVRVLRDFLKRRG